MTTPRHDTAMIGNQDLIDAYLAHLTNLGYPESTIETYRVPLQRVDRELPHGLLAEPAELAGWLAGHASWATRSLYRTALRGFYQWAVATKQLSTDPSTALPRVKRRRRRPRPTTHDQTRLILTEAAEPVRSWSRWMAYGGLRCIEIAALQLPDDVTEETIYVQGKGGKERIVPTHPDLWTDAITRQPGPLGGGLSRQKISGACNREYARLGLKGVTAHRLRHWYGTYVQRAGGNARVTQELLGHADLATTQIYTAVDLDAMREAVLGLPQLAPV
jgi:integrase